MEEATDILGQFFEVVVVQVEHHEDGEVGEAASTGQLRQFIVLQK